jgi:hypothetical protein
MKIVSQSTKKFVAKNFCSQRNVKIDKQRSNDFRLPTTIFSTKVKPDILFVNLKLIVKENLKKTKLSGSKILNWICFLSKRVRVRGYCPERFSIPLKVNKMNLINY